MERRLSTLQEERQPEEPEVLSWAVCRSPLPLNQSVMNGLWPGLLGTDLLNLYGKLQWAGQPLLAPLSPSSCGRGLVAHPILAQPFPAASHPWLSRLSFVAIEGCSGCGVLPKRCQGHL